MVLFSSAPFVSAGLMLGTHYSQSGPAPPHLREAWPRVFLSGAGHLGRSTWDVVRSVLTETRVSGSGFVLQLLLNPKCPFDLQQSFQPHS